MEQTRESFLNQIAQYVAKNRVLSKQITQFLEKVDGSTTKPTFFKGDGMSLLVNPEPQPEGKFRVKVALHSTAVGGDDFSGFRIGLITEDGQRISGRNRGRGHTVFENVPQGKFTLDNWSVMRGQEECYSRETLLGYFQNWMTSQESRLIKAHLLYCETCTQRAATIEQEMATATQASENAAIWPVQWLNLRVKVGIEAIVANTKGALNLAGQWLRTQLIAEPQRFSPGYVRSDLEGIRESQWILANIKGESGNPTEQMARLFIEGLPQIQKGRFRVTLSTENQEYEGYTIEIALQNEKGRLELNPLPLRKRNGKVTATALVPIDDMFGQEKGQIPEGYLPIELLTVSLQPTPSV